MVRILIMNSMIFVYSLVMFSACDKDNPSKPRDPGWYSLGFEDHWALELELDWPYMYACAADEGLFRKRLNRLGAKWEYIGLADTSIAATPFGHYLNRGVQDVIVLESREILVGVFPGTFDVPSIYRSSDNGKSWGRSDTGKGDSGEYSLEGIVQLESSSCEPSTILAGASDAIYSSEDGGLTWRRVCGYVGTGLGINDIQIHPQDCNLVWAGGETSRFQEHLLRSIDHGKTWAYVDLRDVVLHDNAIYRIAWHPTNTHVIYFGMQGSVLKTVDYGATWTFPAFPASRSTHFESVLIDDSNPEHLFAAAEVTLYESWDGGRTAQVVEAPNDSRIMDMEYLSGRRTLYLGTLRGVFEYTE